MHSRDQVAEMAGLGLGVSLRIGLGAGVTFDPTSVAAGHRPPVHIAIEVAQERTAKVNLQRRCSLIDFFVIEVEHYI